MAQSLGELRVKVAARAALFTVGDWIEFSIYDHASCCENNDDAVEIKLTGMILSLNERHHARVRHQYGECNTWLPIARKISA